MTTLETSTVEAPAVLVELDPAQVAQHPDNLRDPGRDIKALTASIAEVGVLVPLIVVPVGLVTGHEFPPGITHVAVDGNRRQDAARAAGLPLPCLVRPDLAGARDAARTMAVTDLARDGLTPAEEAHAVSVLFNLRMSSAAIGRAIGRNKTHIAAARKAATLTPDAARLAESYDLTLLDMATIAEWQDTPGAVETLTRAAGRGQLAVLAIEQQERQAVAACRGELETAGVTVLDEPIRGYGTDPARNLPQIRAADAPAGQALTAEEHARLPRPCRLHRHRRSVGRRTRRRYRRGRRRRRRFAEGIAAVARYVCTDPARYRHLGLWAAARADTDTDSAEFDDDGTGDEAVARHADAQAQARETARVQRAVPIRVNKEADAAQGVRRTFLRESLTVKSRAKAMTAWALERVVLRDPVYGGWAGNPWHRSPVLVEILGENPGQVAADTTPAQHGLILWAHVVTAYEEAFNRDAHRQADHSRAAYLQHLQTIGYDLADVEASTSSRPPRPLDRTRPPKAVESVTVERPAEPAA